MSMLPLVNSGYQQEQLAAWRDLERLYAIGVLANAANLALAQCHLRCSRQDGRCEACAVDRVIGEHLPDTPRPAD